MRHFPCQCRSRKNTLAYNSFRWRSIRLFNSLPFHIRSISSCLVLRFNTKLDIFLGSVEDLSCLLGWNNGLDGRDCRWLSNNNCKFVNLPREKLFDSIIRNMQKRLMDSNHLLTRKNDEDSNLLHELIHLVEPHSWNIEEITVPWMKAEEKRVRFQEFFAYKINVEDVLQNGENHTMPPSIRRPKAS